MPAIRAELRITGRVQGVFFRASTADEASDLGLTGWVRNLRDGTVEVVVEGEEPLVDRLIRWCHSGPPGARVTEVEVERRSATGEFPDFRVR